MSRKQIILAIAVAMVVSVMAFQGGRETVVASRTSPASIEPTASAPSSPAKARASTPSMEDSKPMLTNLAAVPFGELFDLMRGVSPETRRNWAKQLESLPAGSRKLAAIEAFYKVLVQLDASAATQLVLEIADFRLRRQAIEAVVGAFREPDIEIIAEMIIKLHLTTDPKTQLSTIAGEWIQVDPPAAVRFLEEHRDQIADTDIYSYMWTWSIVDPVAARSWLERQDPSQRTQNVIEGFVLGWYEDDPAAALEYAAANSDSKEFHTAIDSIARNIIRETREKPVDFIEKMTAPAREVLIDAVIQSTKIPEPSNSSDDVAKWLVALSDPIWTGRINDLLGTWEKKDGESVLYWIEGLPAEKREQVLSEHSPQGEGIPRERVFSLAMEITDLRLRDAALGKFAGTLGKTREEALHSLRDLNISAAQKHYLQSFLKSK